MAGEALFHHPNATTSTSMEILGVGIGPIVALGLAGFCVVCALLYVVYFAYLAFIKRAPEHGAYSVTGSSMTDLNNITMAGETENLNSSWFQDGAGQESIKKANEMTALNEK